MAPLLDLRDLPDRMTGPHRAGVMGYVVPAAVNQPVKPSIAFALSDATVKLDPLEEEVIYLAQQSFADEMKSSPDADPTSPEYAAHWKRAVETHDDYLRRTLGWDKFNHLSALASQRNTEEVGVLK